MFSMMISSDSRRVDMRLGRCNVGVMTIRDQLTNGGIDPFLFKHERQDERHR